MACDVGHIEGIPTCRERDVGHIEGIPTCRERDVGHIEGFPTCRERDVGHIEGIPTCRERDVGRMDAQIRDKARSSPAVGLLRALWTHFASAPFSAPVAEPVLGGGNHAAHYQAVTAAQSQGPGGVGSVGYVEVAGHDDSESDYYSTSIISKNISRVCSSSSFLVSSWKPFLR